MKSGIAWLDTSADEEHRVREMIALFSQRESRDELGIGQIRDAFSDALFPGTSVIQTRARYFLIVPWVFNAASRKGSGQALLAHAQLIERRLVEQLREAGAVDGLIGRLAGAAVKILPSSIYWSGLRTYGILTHDVAPDQLAAHAPVQRDEVNELEARVIGDWDPTLPKAPEEFPQSLPGGLDLSEPEARWLRERILAAVPGTLLAHLLAADHAPDPTSPFPWRDSLCSSAADAVRKILRHAELFSLTINGAALLYNLLVGERYEAAGLSRVVTPVQTYRDAYGTWLQALEEAQPQLQSWDREAFWSFVRRCNPRITDRTRLFVVTWTNAVLDKTVYRATEDAGLRATIADRERAIKKSQSRLTNDKLLGAWSGESGSGRLAYRWPQVRRIVTDIHQGMQLRASA